MNQINNNDISEFSAVRDQWNELYAYDYFLTYARCDISINKMERLILSKFDKIKEKIHNEINFIVIAKEEHSEIKDGVLHHYHVFIRFMKKMKITSPNFFDFKYKINDEDKTFHPSITTVKKPGNCMAYTVGLVEKKGNKINPNLIARNVNVEEFINDKRNNNSNHKKSAIEKNQSGDVFKEKDIMEMLINKSITLIEAIKIRPSLIKSYNTLKKNLETFFRDEEEIINVKKLTDFKINNLSYTFNSGFKEAQYWICGKNDMGKSTFINELKEQGYTFYQIPKNNDHKYYADGKYSAAYIDEFNSGHLTYDFLNEWLQGNEMNLNIKGGSTIKKDHFPTFILSNKFPWEVYKNDIMIKSTILARMKVIYMDKTDKGRYISTELWSPEYKGLNIPYPPDSSTVFSFKYDWFDKAFEEKLDKYFDPCSPYFYVRIFVEKRKKQIADYKKEMEEKERLLYEKNKAEHKIKSREFLKKIVSCKDNNFPLI